jgi:hypothetical protein
MHELLAVTATEKLQALVLCMKNRDATVSKMIRENQGFARAHEWPPTLTDRVRAKTNHVRAWVLWPKFVPDPDHRRELVHWHFRNAFLGSLSRGNRLLVADDLIALTKWVGMGKDISYLYWNGRSDGCGLWGAIQRPFFAPGEAYSQSNHIFMANSPDKRDRERYRDIGGISPETIEHNLSRCKKYQWLYIHRETETLCIVDR